MIVTVVLVLLLGLIMAASEADDDDSAGPQRFEGTAIDLEAVMMPFADADLAFCKYADESKNVQDAKVVNGDRGIEGHHLLLAALYGMQPNLSFSKTVMEGALDIMIKKCAKKWRMTTPEQADWLITMNRRIRNLCRVVSQGQLEQPQPAWLKHLPWAGTETPASALKEKAATPAKYKYTFDVELQLPVRTRLSDNFVEPGLPLRADFIFDKDGFLMAEWPDGDQAVMQQITPELLRSYAKHGELFGITHKDTKNRVCLKQKVDRVLLVAAYEQTSIEALTVCSSPLARRCASRPPHQRAGERPAPRRQRPKIIVCVRMNLFGKIEDERCQVDPGHPACKAAVEFLKPLVINYASGKIERGKLNDLKHEMLKEQNIKSVKKSKGVPMKRPASAMKKPAAAVEASDGEDGAEDEDEVPVTEINPPPKVEAKQAAKKVRVPKSKVAGKPKQAAKKKKVPASKVAGKLKQASKKMKEPKVTEETKLSKRAAKEVTVAAKKTYATSVKAVSKLLAAKRPAAAAATAPRKSWSLSAPLPSVMSDMERFLSWPA